MKKISIFSQPLTLWLIIFLSWAFWYYLIFHTQMVISCDAIGYERNAHMLKEQGLMAFLSHGPQREPVYLFIVASSITISQWIHCPYTLVMAFIGFFSLCLSQFLLIHLLTQWQVHRYILYAVVGYFALSPSIINSAYSLYSEITCLPLMLTLCTFIFYLFQKPQHPLSLKNILLWLGLGINLSLLTLSKAVFECISPLLLVLVFTLIWHEHIYPKKRILFALILGASLLYAAPVLSYKLLNQHVNGQFAITNRASWALYGNVHRRIQPLTISSIGAALAYVPGENVCLKLFSRESCDFWSYKPSDFWGTEKFNQLSKELPSPQQVEKELLHLSIKEAMSRPLQFILLWKLEGLKMLFWESTQIGFVNYPTWLEKIHQMPIISQGLRALTSVATCLGLITALGIAIRTRNRILIAWLGLIILYVGFYAIFFILTRYAIPIAPIFLLIIGIAAQDIFFKHQSKSS